MNGYLCTDMPSYCDSMYKTAANISPLYQFDAFDWTVLIIYFGILSVLAIYGVYRVKQVIEFWRYSRFPPKAKDTFAEDILPQITIQLPLFNEMYVVERLVKAVAKIDYPRELLEIQVLDDSTDETVKIARATVEKYACKGFDIHYIHRTDRTGFKAGALENGMKSAKGELIAIFDADFVPKPDFLRKLVHHFTDPIVGCAQMRWAHINGSYNLLTRLQTIMLDGHFVVEQTTRNRSGNFFNFNGTAGIWRRDAIEMSGGWQHDTLTEDTDLSFRAQLMGWRFVYLLDEEAPAEIPVDVNAFKAQQRRWAKGVLQVWFKLYRRIWYARAVLEALAGVKSEFVRTPKYRVEKTDDESWKLKKYKRKHGWLPLLELSFAFYFVLAIAYAVRMHMWGPIGFLLLFCFGYGYMGTMSLLQTASGRRLAAVRPAAKTS